MASAVCFDYRRLFTLWMVCVFLLDSFTFVYSGSVMVVSRMSDGDQFTKPLSASKIKGCGKFQALCVKDLVMSCNECKCGSDNETYRSDLKKCVSSKNLDNYTGCLYKGLAGRTMDEKIRTLDFMKKGKKEINAPINLAKAIEVTCGIGNGSSYMNQNGKWIILKNISQALGIAVSKDHDITVPRYLTLRWEEVGEEYWGLLIKLHIVCKSVSGVVSEINCFLFKTKGIHTEKIQVSTSGRTFTITNELSTENSHPTLHSERDEHTTLSSPALTFTSTRRNVLKNFSYSISRNVIIGVSAGVGFVILIIVIVAICCVRHRMRNSQEKQVAVSIRNESPKVHFTAQTRFSLIRESVQEIEPEEPSPNDYTCLQDSRERYDPYCSLRKDDVDLNVIDQILKEAVSLESMAHSSEPRYSCRLSGDQTVIAPRLPSPEEVSREYHVLEGPGDTNEPDYEQVDSSDDEDVSVVAKLLDSKPPLPERQYHILEKPTTTAISEC